MPWRSVFCNRDQDPDRYPRAAVRWHSRFCSEVRNVAPEDAQLALAALLALRGPRPDPGASRDRAPARRSLVLRRSPLLPRVEEAGVAPAPAATLHIAPLRRVVAVEARHERVHPGVQRVRADRRRAGRSARVRATAASPGTGASRPGRQACRLEERSLSDPEVGRSLGAIQVGSGSAAGATLRPDARRSALTARSGERSSDP